MAHASISLDGIEKAVSGLNYKNPNIPKYRLIHAIKTYYTEKDALKRLDSIPPEALIPLVWPNETDPDQIRSKLKNLNSIKSSVNKDLIKCFEKGTNPEGIIIGTEYVFDMSDEAKDQFIGSMSSALSAGGPVSLDQIAQISQQFGEFLTKIPDGDVLTFLSTLIDTLKSDRPLPAEQIPEMLNLFGDLLSDIPDHELLKEQDKIRALVRNLSEKTGESIIEDETDTEEALEEEGDPIEVVDVLLEEDEIEADEVLDGAEDLDEMGEIHEDELVYEMVDEDSDELDDTDELEETEDDDFEEVIEEDNDPIETIDVLVEDDEDLEAADELEIIDEDELDEVAVEDEAVDFEELEEIVDDDGDEDDTEIEEVIEEEDDSIETVDVLVEDDEDLEAADELEIIDEDELDEVAVEDEAVDFEELEEIDETETVVESDDDAETVIDNFDAPHDFFADDDLMLDNSLSDRERKRLLAERFDRYLGEMEKHYNQYLLIPGGEYITGAENPGKNDRPLQKITISDIFFGRFPVTNSLFEVFVERTGYRTTAEECGFGVVYQGRFQKTTDEITGKTRYVWNATSAWERREGAFWYQPFGPGSTLHRKRNHPVVQISFRDAMAFASWVGKRLPSELEWEAAARTADGNLYPWGNEWKDGVCNTEESEISDTVAVDHCPDAKNAFGLSDLMGNVLEWTVDRWEGTGATKNHQDYHIVKGGSWISNHDVKLYSRFKYPIQFTANILGFRCLAD